MALEKQVIPMPLTKGINEFQPDALKDPDTLASGDNCEMLKTGEVVKRHGFVREYTVTGGVSITSGLLYGRQAAGFTKFNSEYGTPDKDASSVSYTTVRQTSPSLSYPLMAAKVFDLVGSGDNVINVDCSTTTDNIYIAVVTQSTAGAISCTVYNYDLYFNLVGSKTLSMSSTNNGSIRMVYGRLITWVDALTDNYTVYDYTNNGTTFIGSGVVIANSSIGIWDACELTGTSYVLVYDNGTNIVIAVYNGTTLSTSTTISRTNVTRLCVFRDTGTAANSDICVGLLRSTGNKIEVQRFNSSLVLQQTLSLSGGSDTYYNISGIRTPDLLQVGSPFDPQIFLAVEYGSSTASETSARGVRVYSVDPGPVLVQLGADIQRAGIASRFFKQPQISTIVPYPQIVLSHRSEDAFNLQNSYFVVTSNLQTQCVEVDAHPVYGQATNYRSRVISSNYGPNSGVVNFITASSLMPMIVRSDSGQITADTSASYVVRGCLMEYAIDAPFSRSINYGGINILAGGIVKRATPAGYAELSFELYPDAPQGFTSTGAGSVAAGSYQYLFVYEHTDDQGNLIESAPSQVTSVTHAGTNNYTVSYLRPGWVTLKSFRLAMYRTTASGTIFYRAKAVDYNPSTLTFGTLTDDVADGVLETKKILYTTGNVVENIAPPNSRYLSFVKKRLWTFESGSFDTVWFTKEVNEGLIPRFSDLLTISVDRAYGEVMAVAGIDDKVCIFKRNAIFTVFGDGPSDTLLGSFSQPTLIAQGVGLTAPRSLVETPYGIVFNSDEGVYLLDKGMTLQFLGQPLYKSVSTITASCYDPVYNRVMILSGTSLWVFYFTSSTWFQWTVPLSNDILYIDGSIYLLTKTTQRVLKLSSDSYQDDAADFTQTIKTGQLQFAGIQGYQRVYRVLLTGNATGDESGTVTVKNYYNGSRSVTDTQTLTFTNAVVGNRIGIEVRPSIQKCETMQMELSHTGNNPGLTLSAMTAEVGAISGSGRRAATRRAV